MEAAFSNKSRTHVDTFVKESLQRLSYVLDARAKRFDEHFKELMESSKKAFHEMFKRTYGVIYLQNSFVFTDFFQELENYYATGRVRLSEVLDTFFGVLYQRMFVVINAQYTFSDDYLQCVLEHMVELGPFGDVPHKLGVQLRRAFVATRAFYRALAVGADVVKKAVNAYSGADSECLLEMMRMQDCAACNRHLPPPGSCSSFCIHTLKRCLRTFDVLDKPWDAYVDAVDKVGDRLLGPFNIEMVVEPINIKISEAVMNFQENGAEVSERVFSGCGKPIIKRETRNTKDSDISTSLNSTTDSPDSSKNVSTTELSQEPPKFGNGSGNNKKKRKKVMEAARDGGNEPSLDKLIKDIKQRVKDSRRFWSHLPYQFCNNEPQVAGPSSNGSCWNGTAVGAFEPSSLNLSAAGVPFTEIQNLPFALQTIVNKLQAAYQGQDVDLANDDTEETIAEASGSGSGDFDSDLEIEGSGSKAIFSETSEPPSVITHPPEPPPPPKTPKDGQPTEHTPKVTGSGSSLHQALVHLLLPIVFAWIGGIISDLLQL